MGSTAAEPPDPQPDPLDTLTARELLLLLNEEVARLPENYRLAVVHCCLEGRTVEEAARQLGWSPGSVRGRLARGRARLHKRLVRRGVLPSAAVLALELSPGVAPAALPVAILAAATNPGGAAPLVTELAEGVLKTMSLSKLKAARVLVFAVTLLAVGGTVRHASPSGNAAVAAPAPLPPKPKPPRPWSAKTRKAVAAIKGDLASFELFIQFHGALGQPYHTIVFLTNSRNWTWTPFNFHGDAVIRKEVAIHLIDLLADQGYFDRASLSYPSEEKRPSYSLDISSKWLLRFNEPIGWGPKMYQRLRSIRKLLEGDPAKRMDQVLAALEPERKKWPIEEKGPRTSAWGPASNGLRCRVQTPAGIEQGMPLPVRVELGYDPKRLPVGVKALNHFMTDAFFELELVHRPTGKRLTVTPFDPTLGMLAQDDGRSAVPLDGHALKPWKADFPLVELGNALTPGSWACRVRYSFPKGPTRWWREGEKAWTRAGFWHGTITSDTFRLEVRKETPKTRVLLLPKRLRLGKGSVISYGKEDAEKVTLPVRNGHFLSIYIPPGELRGGVPAPGRELGTWGDHPGRKGKGSFTIEVFETADPPSHFWDPRMKVLWSKTFTFPGGQEGRRESTDSAPPKGEKPPPGGKGG